MDIRIKRAYSQPAPEDGQRVLVDRLWPRGVAKAKAQLALWARDAAPSTALRERFHRNEIDFAGLVHAYRAELDAQPQAVAALRELARVGRLTLVYAARDEEHNNATVLRDYLLGKP